MANKAVGSIVATVVESGLKTVLHVKKDGGTVTFTKPDNPDWSHHCHASNEGSPQGWVREVETISAPTFKDAQFFPVDVGL
ncbi:hypothetical protein [Saliniramus fredricksonii]|uniref:hypothetical protein n=1 Tax=Saliniramus fredricksonii TaxID=1653334 RepID=UPI00104274BE|nr:hypothetical protein [Saliniramus fredricksonii]